MKQVKIGLREERIGMKVCPWHLIFWDIEMHSSTVDVPTPDIPILDTFKNRTYLCSVFESSFSILFLVRVSKG
jgi:hypothetical protein